MKQIEKNEYYEIAIDESKNRLYLSSKGFWPNISAVQRYNLDLRQAISQLEKGFTVLNDISTFKTPPREVQQLLSEAIEIMKNNGIGKTATLVGGDVVMQIASERIARNTNTESIKAHFKDKISAEIFLDSK